MSTSITVLHVQGQRPEEVEEALTAIFAREERPRVLRIEGTFSAVLRRATDPDLDAGYRYLVLRPHPSSTWAPVLELGNRTEGLDAELSKALGGCAVFTAFVYGDVVAGYRLARGGAEVDRYLSDPTAVADEDADDDTTSGNAGEPAGALEAKDGEEEGDAETVRGHPERFADLLPSGTAPDEFARVVLRPGWWEQRDAEAGASGAGTGATDAPATPATTGAGDASEADGDEDIVDEDIVDEADRMRCIGLALELWAEDEYPFAQDPEDIPDTVAGPAIAVAFA